MRSQEKSYHCSVCRWNGMLEPTDAGDAAACPHCGVFLYPQSWAQTWGLALGMIVTVVAFVLASAVVFQRMR